MLRYFCIPSCDKCRRARGLLRDKGIAHIEINYRRELTAEQLATWFDRYGLDALLNTRSNHYRQLDIAAQTALTHDPVPALLGEPAMLHRPLLDFGDHILVGKSALDYLEGL